MDDYTNGARSIKASVWGLPEANTDYMDFYRQKFTGEAIDHPRTNESAAWTEFPIREGYSNTEYLEKRWAGIPKTSSSVTRAGMHLRGIRVTS